MSLTQIFSFSHCLLFKAGLLKHLHFQNTNTNYICLKWGKTTALEFFVGMRLFSLLGVVMFLFSFLFFVNLCESEIMDTVISYVTLSYKVKVKSVLIQEKCLSSISKYSSSLQSLLFVKTAVALISQKKSISYISLTTTDALCWKENICFSNGCGRIYLSLSLKSLNHWVKF